MKNLKKKSENCEEKKDLNPEYLSPYTKELLMINNGEVPLRNIVKDVEFYNSGKKIEKHEKKKRITDLKKRE